MTPCCGNTGPLEKTSAGSNSWAEAGTGFITLPWFPEGFLDVFSCSNRKANSFTTRAPNGFPGIIAGSFNPNKSLRCSSRFQHAEDGALHQLLADGRYLDVGLGPWDITMAVNPMTWMITRINMVSHQFQTGDAHPSIRWYWHIPL